VHRSSVEAIAEGVLDGHVDLWQLEQFSLQAVDRQVLGRHTDLLGNFLNRDIAHRILLVGAVSYWLLERLSGPYFPTI
jgi:hypothetical protein